MKIIFLLELVCLLTITFLILDYFMVEAQEPRVWECYPNSCQVPNQYTIKSKNHEIEEDRKFQFKTEKIMAKETTKFPQLGKQNKTILELDKKRRGNFSAYSFPNSGN